MDEQTRSLKRGKFGSRKYVYRAETMRAHRDWFEDAIADRLPGARVLYWT
jgi:spore photoproduct lyase